jgi:hypothetical protein
MSNGWRPDAVGARNVHAGKPSGPVTIEGDIVLSEPVTVDGTVSVNEPVSVDDNGGSLTVDNPILSVVGGGAEATAQRVTIASDSSGVLSVDDNGGSLTVDGPLTDAELRASPVPISGTVSVTEPVSMDDNGGSITVDGPVTDAQLRATPVPVSGTVSVTEPVSVDDNGGSLTVDASNLDIRDLSSSTDSVTAVGPLTDAQLRAAAVPVSGTVSVTEPVSVDDNGASLTVDNTVLSVVGGGTEATAQRVTIANDSTGVLSVDDNGGSLTVDGPLTDAQLRATAVPVSGTVTTTPSGTQTVALSQSGTNNDVDVLTLPSGTVAGSASLPAGTNAIGKLAANSGVDIGDVDVTSLPSDLALADDAAFTAGTTKVINSGFFADEASTDSVDEGDTGAARMTLDRRQIVVNQPHAAGGASIFRSLDLDETEEEVKATAGTVYGWYIANTATATRFVKFYNATAANVTVGTTTPVLTLPIPGNSSDDIAANLLGGVGIAFDTAITVAATTALADNDTGAPAANDVIINLFYK